MFKIIALTSLLSCVAMAEVQLVQVEREVLKKGLHRTLRTNVTYTMDHPGDTHCSWIFRERISKDMYIYYEEVTKDMPGFAQYNWPHHLPMNIESPAQAAIPQDFIWELPLKADKPMDSYIKHFESNSTSTEDLPKRNFVTVEFPIHYRYQPVQSGSDYAPITMPDPEVFIDCIRESHGLE